ncbi:hypothetical protein [Piscinibacterium candidicorallinum]|uniref:PEGA domain-containing protein n=1 Tax=Piscinibacterium candidicorallinum TaxID=1793872 RepID=A0ABV7HBR3_9BURK
MRGWNRTRRRGAQALGAAFVATLGLGACSTPLVVPNGSGIQAIKVPEENYALFEVEITEPGTYALQVIDLDPQASQRRVARASNLARLAGGLDAGLTGATRSSIGTDTFDAFAGVIWSVYGRKPAQASAATAAPAASSAAATPPAAATATRAGTDLGPRLMQSPERPLSETGKRAPERARLEPGRYVIRVATGYGTVRTQADRVEVGLVRLADGSSVPAGDRVTAVPVQRAGAPATRIPAPPPAPQR